MELVRLSPVLSQQVRKPAQVMGRALAQVESARQASEPGLPWLEQVLLLVRAELARLVPELRLPERGK